MTQEEIKTFNHKPLDVFNCFKDRPRFAIVVLNTPIKGESTTLCYLWNAANYRVTVDGGTDLIHGLLKDNKVQNNMDLITGDFDSVNAEVLDHYKKIGVQVVSTPEQDDTDFTKCLRVVMQMCDSKIEVDTIVVYAENVGRFDHIMSNINTLYKFVDNPTAFPAISTERPDIYLFGQNSCSFALQAECNHFIHINHPMRGDCCGILPIGNRCKVTTEGFKWDMNNCDTGFGSLVSSSNAFASTDTVRVNGTQTLVFTMDLHANHLPQS